mgnify:FL=1
MLVLFVAGCYHIDERCDGMPDCPGYPYELDTCYRCHPNAVKCANETVCVNQIYVCDGISQCKEGTDELGGFFYSVID